MIQLSPLPLRPIAPPGTLLEGLPRGAVRAYADARRLGLVDHRVVPLVDAMNVPGVVSTTASCEGHRNWAGWYSSPYVAFKAPEALAAQLVRLLRGADAGSQSRLRLYWEITGYFDVSHALVYRLGAMIDRRLWSRPIRRADVDGDIATLCGMVAAVIAGYERTMPSRSVSTGAPA